MITDPTDQQDRDVSWEARSTALIVANIIREKDRLGLTTAEFTDRCNHVVQSQFRSGDTFKVATVNGLFAGKRKNISVAELAIYATALDVPPLVLLFDTSDLSQAPRLPQPSLPLGAFTASRDESGQQHSQWDGILWWMGEGYTSDPQPSRRRAVSNIASHLSSWEWLGTCAKNLSLHYQSTVRAKSAEERSGQSLSDALRSHAVEATARAATTALDWISVLETSGMKPAHTAQDVYSVLKSVGLYEEFIAERNGL